MFKKIKKPETLKPILKIVSENKNARVYSYEGDPLLKNVFELLCDNPTPSKNDRIFLEKIEKNKLLFSSKKEGINYVRLGIHNGTLDKKCTYILLYLDANGNIVSLALINGQDNGSPSVSAFINIKLPQHPNYRVIVPCS